MMALKYPTYQSLIEAYQSGALTEPMCVDNDDCFVYEDDEKVFSGNGDRDYETLLDLLKIPWDYA